MVGRVKQPANVTAWLDWKVAKLDWLDVSNNQLISLPDSIGNLQVLSVLHVSYNQLISLPNSFGGLRNLTELHLRNNKLPLLPKSIGDMQGLLWLDVSHNKLNSLPEESIGKLQKLKWLDVSYNQLRSLPHPKFGKLVDLRASGNRLEVLPESLGNLEWLETLALGHNNLERLPKNLMRLSKLRSVFVDSNQLQYPSELCNFERSMLRVLYAHKNRLQGEMPVCLTRYTSMQALTLHSNLLNGSIPRALSRLPELKLLTLHKNFLSGSLPTDFAKATSLTLFSAYSNDLKGCIPPFNLSKECLDDASFLNQDGNPCYKSDCRRADVASYCRRSCNLCNEAKARGPVLLLHNNRLSCDLPEQVTKFAKDIRSISLVGNMLGNGSIGLPTWIHSDEQQEFLYLSHNKMMDMFWMTMRYIALLLVCTVVFTHFTRICMPEFGNILHAEAGTRLLHRSHLFVWRLCIALSSMAAVLLILYRSHSTYYECKTGFSSTTCRMGDCIDVDHVGCSQCHFCGEGLPWQRSWRHSHTSHDRSWDNKLARQMCTICLEICVLFAVGVCRDNSIASLYILRACEHHPFQQHLESSQFRAELLPLFSCFGNGLDRYVYHTHMCDIFSHGYRHKKIYVADGSAFGDHVA